MAEGKGYLEKLRKLKEEIAERFEDPVVASVILAEEMADAIASRLEGIEVRTPRYTEETLVVRKENVRLDRFARLFDETGEGRLREVTVVSNDPDFELYVYVDDLAKVQGSFSQLRELSPYLNLVDAFETDDGKYVLHISEIGWRGRCRVDLIPGRSILFDRIIILCDIKKEVK